MSSLHFANFNEEHIPFRDITEEEALVAFCTVDKRGEGYVLPSELRMVLRATLGGQEATVRQTKVVEAMVAPTLRSHASGGRIPFAAWFAGLKAAADYMEREVLATRPESVKRSVVLPTTHHEAMDATRRSGVTAVSLGLVPGGGEGEGGAGGLSSSLSLSSPSHSMSASALASSASGGGGAALGSTAAAAPSSSLASSSSSVGLSKTGQVAGSTGLCLRGPEVASSYGRDIGGPTDPGPAGRPAKDPLSASLFTTTRDLASGTSRQSQHIPGFAGHVPTLVGGRAPLHGRGLGADVRDTFDAKTNLTETTRTRVPGYGGHMPRFSSSAAADVRIPGGQFAPTEHSAAAHVITTYWEARKGALALAGKT